MSNLSLPKMTYATLNGMLANNYAKGKYGKLKIAYETTIERLTGSLILVRHHGNPIAEMGPDYFILDNAGWHSVTTANRLNQILRDNQTTLPRNDNPDIRITDRLYYWIHIRQGEMLLSGRDEYGNVSYGIRNFYAHSPYFSRVDSESHFVLHG